MFQLFSRFTKLNIIVLLLIIYLKITQQMLGYDLQLKIQNQTKIKQDLSYTIDCKETYLKIQYL